MNPFEQAFSLRDEVALITGGGSGIGLAIATAMSQAGARVVLVGRREDALKHAAQAIGDSASCYVHDVTHADGVTELVARISSEVGAITCLVNNAGVHIKKPALETTEGDLSRALATHVVGAHTLVRAVAPGMVARKHGSILFIASMASFIGVPLVLAYSAAKTAQLGLVRTLASELSPHGVRVNAIAPGWIDTAMSRGALADDPDRLKKVLSRTPAARLGTPADVGWAAVYLASPAANYVTGAILAVDGGTSIGF